MGMIAEQISLHQAPKVSEIHRKCNSDVFKQYCSVARPVLVDCFQAGQQ